MQHVSNVNDDGDANALVAHQVCMGIMAQQEWYHCGSSERPTLAEPTSPASSAFSLPPASLSQLVTSVRILATGRVSPKDSAARSADGERQSNLRVSSIGPPTLHRMQRLQHRADPPTAPPNAIQIPLPNEPRRLNASSILLRAITASARSSANASQPKRADRRREMNVTCALSPR